MSFARILRHAFSLQWHTRRRFPAQALAAVEREIAVAERQHGGEIRVVIETRLDAGDVWAGLAPRARAEQVFQLQRVWDTELNNGVLIYILMADHDVEIVADRGFNGRVTPAEWEEVCRQMETEFRAGHFPEAVIAGVKAAGALIARHFPPDTADRNELPDAPVLS